MKTVLIILFLFGSCGDKKANVGSEEEQAFLLQETYYEVKKIEAFENHYFIHLEKESSFYKVLSPKIDSNNCNPIKEGKRYSFSLNSIWHNEIKLEDGRTFNSPLNVDCKSFENIGEVCLEDNPSYIKDLFKISDLKGLCYEE